MVFTLFDDVLNAYTKIFRNPAVVVVFLLAFFEMVDLEKEIHPTLFEKLVEILQDAQTKPVTPIAKTLATALLWFVRIAKSNEKLLIPQVFVWIPYFLKETSSNLLFTSIFSVVTMVLSSWSMLQTFLYGQLWYLFTELDNNWNRVLIAIFCILTFIYQPLSLHTGSELHNSFKVLITSLPNVTSLT